MADIEQRRDDACDEYIDGLDTNITDDFYYNQEIIEAAFKAGYISGVNQTLADYAAQSLSKGDT